MRSKQTSLLILLLLVLIGCKSQSTDKQSPQQFLASLPRVTPQKIIQFNVVDSNYFEHIGYNTIPTSKGGFVLPDRASGKTYLINKNGNW